MIYENINLYYFSFEINPSINLNSFINNKKIIYIYIYLSKLKLDKLNYGLKHLNFYEIPSSIEISQI